MCLFVGTACCHVWLLCVKVCVYVGEDVLSPKIPLALSCQFKVLLGRSLVCRVIVPLNCYGGEDDVCRLQFG